MCGSSTTQSTTQEFRPPQFTQSETNPFWSDYVKAGAQLTQVPYQQYQGQTVAPLNEVTNTGLQAIVDRGLNGSPTLRAANGQATATANGSYMGQGPQANVTPGTNPFAGSNAYLNQMIGNNAFDMTRAFQTGTAAQNDSAANLAGSFGGGGWIAKQSADAANLAHQVGEMATQNRFQDYQTQQGLAESALGRDMAAQQFNTQANMGQYDAERNRMLQGAQLGGNLAAQDMGDLQKVVGAGDAYQNYQQQLLDASKAEFDRQQQYPYQQLDAFGNVLSRASGTGNSGTASTNGGGISPILAALGLGTGAYAAGKFLA